MCLDVYHVAVNNCLRVSEHHTVSGVVSSGSVSVTSVYANIHLPYQRLNLGEWWVLCGLTAVRAWRLTFVAMLAAMILNAVVHD